MLKGDLVITAVSLAIENSSVVFLLDKLNACFSTFSFMAKEGSLENKLSYVTRFTYDI